MKRILLALALAAAETAPASMPIGLRTAVWGISAANERAAVARVLPEAGDATEVGEALRGLHDAALATNIVSVSDYREFRTWALQSGARADALAASPAVWLSFAVDSPTLVAEPEDGDLTIDEISPVDADGRVEIVFSLADVMIGRDAIEARLKSVFNVIGSEMLDNSSFSDRNLSLSLFPTDDGRVRAIVEPTKDASGNAPSSFFMRVKTK